MNKLRLLVGGVLAVTSVWAIAQEAPESLLPPGFDRPAPRPAAPKPAQARPAQSADPAARSPAPQTPAAKAPETAPAVVALPAAAVAPLPSVGASSIKLPSLDALEKLSPEEFEDVLGLKPKSDIPAAARRAMTGVGVLAVDEGGLPPHALAAQNASLVRAALVGNKGQLVSRWGHILLRRALASRLDAPAGMNPADFAAMRADLLLRMGEGEAARALVQDIDTGNYTPALTQSAFNSYVFTADFTGICPAVTIQGGARAEPQWEVSRAICAAFQGEGNDAMNRLDRAEWRGVMPRIDMMLARKYAGAAGKTRRAVAIDWKGVSDMTPWRYGLTLAVGLEPPQELMRNTDQPYSSMAATAPMLGLESRATAADRAAGQGILSSAAMVDLYGQIYGNGDITGDWSDRASQLRDAYVGADASARLAAMQQLWGGPSDAAQRYSRQVLTAYAAARLPASEDMADNAFDLVVSMLTAGLDRNAMRWSKFVESGTDGWAVLAAASPTSTAQVQASAIRDYRDNDDSEGGRRSAFLLAGLAGLDRISSRDATELAGEMKVDLSGRSRWTQAIDEAARVGNPALVALLAGLGMQGTGWDKMTARQLFHLVGALRKVGLDAEARMIAAEAVARG